MRKSVGILFAALLVLSSVFCSGQAIQRKKIDFDENWKFRFGHASDPSRDFNYCIATIFSKSGGAARTAIDARFNDTAWRTLNLPHDWAVELPFQFSPSGEVESHG